jgi:putative ABC transport system permease protein
MKQKSIALYRLLLKLYPARFREEYGRPMERQFSDDYADSQSARERIILWLHALRDLALTAPVQIASEMVADGRYAFRSYRKRPLSIALTWLTLSLAIGASTGVFTVLSAVLLRSLPFSDAYRLVELWLAPVNLFKGRAVFYDHYGKSSYVQNAATYIASDMNVRLSEHAFRLKTAETSANFFRVLGVHPMRGRDFESDEDVTGKNRLAILSYGVWQQFYAGDPGVIGRTTLSVNGREFTIVGIAPPNFDYPAKTALWLPTAFDIETIPKEGVFFPETVARLKPGVSLRLAAALFDADWKRLSPERNRHNQMADWRNRPHLSGLQSQIAGPVERAAWVLAAITLLVLLTACANVGHLFLSRATERQSELNLRMALGASRGRLLQQLITEATLLTASSTLAGLLFARWIAHIANWIVPAQLTTQNYTVLDWRVLFFSVSLVLIFGLVFGIAPLWTSGWAHSYDNKHRSDAGLANRASNLMRRLLLCLQTAITLILLASSLVLGRGFVHLLHADLGFKADGLLGANVSLEGTRHSGQARWSYYTAVLDRLHQLPGIESAAAVSYAPLVQTMFMVADLKLDSGQTIGAAIENSVTPGYFQTIHTALLAGSDFSATRWKDRVIVNRAFARASGLANAIVGRFVLSPWNKNQRFLIQGVAGTTALADPEVNDEPQIYWPLEGEPPSRLTFMVRTSGEAEESLARLRAVIRSVDTQVPVFDVATISQRIDEALLRPKFYTVATAALTLTVFVLAAAGLFGAATYAVAQRQHEIGIRIALGASPAQVRRMITQEGALAALAGVVLGAVAFLLCSNTLQELIQSAERPTPLALVTTSAVLFLASIAASWVATDGVMRVDPIAAVRAE